MDLIWAVETWLCLNFKHNQDGELERSKFKA